MLSFLCQVWDRVQMVALATWPPPSLSRSPDCEMQSAVSSPFAMSRRFLRRCLSVETNNFEDDSGWQYWVDSSYAVVP